MLSDLRVLDLTDGPAGIAGRIFSQLRTEVILIEPSGGVTNRSHGPFVDDVEDPERSLAFWSHHGGKRSVVVDAESAIDRDRLLDLVCSADVQIDDRSFVGLAERFAANALQDAAPRLIHTLSCKSASGKRNQETDELLRHESDLLQTGPCTPGDLRNRFSQGVALLGKRARPAVMNPVQLNIGSERPAPS